MKTHDPNIIFIVIDACRPDHLGCYGYPKDTSPNIDKIAREGILFENAFSSVCVTDSSLTTIFSGRYPLTHGIMSHGSDVSDEQIQKLDQSGTVFLPEILSEKGYTTISVDWLGRWHTRGYDFYSGINQKEVHKTRSKKIFFRNLLKPFFDKIPYRIKPYLEGIFRKLPGGTHNARDVTDLSIEIIKENRSKKFFLFLHYWDTHFPYNPPREYWEKFCDNSEERITLKDILDQIVVKKYRDYFKRYFKMYRNTNEIYAKYDGAISYIDSEIGRLMEFVENAGLSKDTVVIITADHGECLYGNNVYFQHVGVSDEVLKVPLIIRYPRMFPSGKKISSLMQHVDIVPTLMDSLWDDRDGDFDGKSFMPLINGEVDEIRSAVFFSSAGGAKSGIRNKHHKYVRSVSGMRYRKICKFETGGDDIESLYNIGGNPGDGRNIIDENPEIANEIKQMLSQWEQTIKNNRKIKKSTSLKVDSSYMTSKDEEDKIKERLKDLGYL